RGAMVALAGALTAAAVVGAPTLAPIAAAYSAGAPLPFVGEFSVHRWDPLNAFRSTFVTADGRLEYDLPTGAFYLLQPAEHYWFAALGVLAIPGLWRA